MKSKKMIKDTKVNTMSNPVKMQEALDLALELALKTSKLLIKRQKKISTLKIKAKDAQGIASDADIESENIIINGIKKKYPTHEILAEESAYIQFHGEMSKYDFLKEKEWVWIIDPLDGTNNFLNGLDYYAVCISLAHYGEPVLGLILRPRTGECFYALKGKGTKSVCYFDDFKKKTPAKKIAIHKATKKIKDSLLVTGFATEKGPVFDQEFEIFKFMMGKSRGIRRMGSAALDLCYVASGVFDCFWERGLAAWDVSAASLICQEAGVKVSDYEGAKFHPFQSTIVAARAPLHKEFLSLFRNGL